MDELRFPLVEDDLDFGERPYHGQGGPIRMRRHGPEELVPWQAAFLEAMDEHGLRASQQVANPGAKPSLDLLREKWSPSLTVPKLLEAIRFLMASPNPDDALRQYLAELTISAAKSGGVDARYADEARRRTAKDAGLSIEEWRQKWKC